VVLSPLVQAVDRFLAAMTPGEWPELTMPEIAHK
jgi:hypothetical protein